MIQAIGLTSTARRRRRPAVDDLTFEARPGQVTVLLGPSGAGKTSALRLLLQLDPGRGVALFRGRPLHSVRQPCREAGVLLGDVPGHPDRTARGHLRMLAAAAGVPAGRADDLLDVVGLSGLAHHRLGSFSLGMDRRLGIAAALLGDPHTLVLDEPARDLSPREAGWLHGLLRGFADQGGAVLTTTRDAAVVGRIADRVVTLEKGRLAADQEAGDFARTRLRPRVAVSSPHAERLAALLTRESRGAKPAGPDDTRMEVVREGGTRIAVYGSSCAAVGEAAYRNGILVHRLADETGDTGHTTSGAPLARVDGRPSADTDGGGRTASEAPAASASAASAPAASDPAVSPGPAAAEASGSLPALPVVPRPGPAAPFRYELHRLLGVRVSGYTMAAALLTALVLAMLLAGAGSGSTGSVGTLRLLTGWPTGPAFPLPPAAVAAGVLGALSFGQEFRYPALAPALAPVPRRLGLLLAKLAVSAGTAVLLCLLTAVLNGTVLALLFGVETLPFASGGTAGSVRILAVLALTVGCAWAGLLAAAVFRSTLAGLAAVAAVPLMVVPLLGVLSGRLLDTAPPVSWPSGPEGRFPVLLRLLAQPVGTALTLSLTVLFGAYVLTRLRRGVR